MGSRGVQRLSSLFISHGAPTLPLEEIPAREFLQQLGTRLAWPKAIVTVSPHWMTRGVEVKSPPRFETWHDFGGFPEALYRIQYTPRGEPDLAERVREMITAASIPVQPSPDAKLDHGVWVPLMLMYPQAEIPVVQVSATWDTPQKYFELGRALRPLAEEEVLLIGSGGLVHNLREIEFGSARVPEWAQRFDDWTSAGVLAGDWDGLFDYRKTAPDAERAHPSEDHFLPLFFAGGAGGDATALHRSFTHGGLGMACYGFT